VLPGAALCCLVLPGAALAMLGGQQGRWRSD
jgi:hypothetical protein